MLREHEPEPDLVRLYKEDGSILRWPGKAPYDENSGFVKGRRYVMFFALRNEPKNTADDSDDAVAKLEAEFKGGSSNAVHSSFSGSSSIGRVWNCDGTGSQASLEGMDISLGQAVAECQPVSEPSETFDDDVMQGFFSLLEETRPAVTDNGRTSRKDAATDGGVGNLTPENEPKAYLGHRRPTNDARGTFEGPKTSPYFQGSVGNERWPHASAESRRGGDRRHAANPNNLPVHGRERMVNRGREDEYDYRRKGTRDPGGQEIESPRGRRRDDRREEASSPGHDRNSDRRRDRSSGRRTSTSPGDHERARQSQMQDRRSQEGWRETRTDKRVPYRENVGGGRKDRGRTGGGDWRNEGKGERRRRYGREERRRDYLRRV